MTPLALDTRLRMADGSTVSVRATAWNALDAGAAGWRPDAHATTRAWASDAGVAAALTDGSGSWEAGREAASLALDALAAAPDTPGLAGGPARLAAAGQVARAALGVRPEADTSFDAVLVALAADGRLVVLGCGGAMAVLLRGGRVAACTRPHVAPPVPAPGPARADLDLVRTRSLGRADGGDAVDAAVWPLGAGCTVVLLSTAAWLALTDAQIEEALINSQPARALIAQAATARTHDDLSAVVVEFGD